MTRGTANSEPAEPEDPQGLEGEEPEEEAPGAEDRSTRGRNIGVEVIRFVLNGFSDDVADGLVWAARRAWEFGAGFL
ncbi:hypothetical protein ACFXD5_38565 [Streptomyces sp. NPDC059385]|uniref:hypothetical protein n=1 Tax=Streptomyces sp. NPDC059385 TaxID=3346817 RepID=UPI0036A7B843